MSSANPEQDRRLRRRAALKSALLRGDAVGVARAWDRLRASGAALRPDEAQAARAARAAVGHALRDARYRREHDADRFGFRYPDAVAPRGLLLRRPSRTGIQVLSGVGLVLLLVALFYFPPAIPGGLPAAAPDPLASAVATAVGGGRGRTTTTAAPVVIAQPSAVPTPATPAPATAAPTSGTGSGTGTGTGQVPPRLATDDRFIFVVLDSDTKKPIEGVCVTYGNQCTATGRKTNAQGIWWIDFPREGAVARLWIFEFWMNGYEPQGRQVPYVPGEPTEPVEIILRKIS